MIYTPLQLHRRWLCIVTIDGNEYEVEDLPSVSRDMDTLVSTATINMAELPDFEPYSPVSIEISIDNGANWHDLYTGYALPERAEIIGYPITCIDELYRVDMGLTEAYALDNTYWYTALDELMQLAGIASDKIDLSGNQGDLSARDIIAQTYPITYAAGTKIQTILKDICEYARYRLYVDVSGVVRIAKYTSIPFELSNIRFSSDNVLPAEYGFYNAKIRVGLDEEKINKVFVSGRNKDGFTPLGFAFASGDGKTNQYTNSLCQSIDQCSELAIDILQQDNRRKRIVSCQMPTDTDIQIGDTISIRCPQIGIAENTNGRIIETIVSGEDMTIALDVQSWEERLASWWVDGATTLGNLFYIAYICPDEDCLFVVSAVDLSTETTYIYYSFDGIKWEFSTIFDGYDGIPFIFHDGTSFIALFYNTGEIYSGYSLTDDFVYKSTIRNVFKIIAFNEIYVIIRSYGIYYGSDLINWTACPIGLLAEAYDIATDGAKFAVFFDKFTDETETEVQYQISYSQDGESFTESNYHDFGISDGPNLSPAIYYLPETNYWWALSPNGIHRSLDLVDWEQVFETFDLFTFPAMCYAVGCISVFTQTIEGYRIMIVSFDNGDSWQLWNEINGVEFCAGNNDIIIGFEPLGEIIKYATYQQRLF